MNKLLIVITLVLMMSACSNKNVKDWTDIEIETWYNKSKWNSLTIKPDASINKREFVEQNLLNPSEWEAAYKFLSESDFNNMELKEYQLSPNGTYANISEYETKDSAHFESHKKYIDIQYLSSGEEYVEISPIENENKVEVTSYNEEKDYLLFDTDHSSPHLLNTKNFLVLFPSDGHKPGMKTENNEMVRKIVVKIPYK